MCVVLPLYDHAEAAAVQMPRLRDRECDIELEGGTLIVMPDTTLGVMLDVGRHVADPRGVDAWRVREEGCTVLFHECAGVLFSDALAVRWYALALLHVRCRVDVALADAAAAVALGLRVRDERVWDFRVA